MVPFGKKLAAIPVSALLKRQPFEQKPSPYFSQAFQYYVDISR